MGLDCLVEGVAWENKRPLNSSVAPSCKDIGSEEVQGLARESRSRKGGNGAEYHIAHLTSRAVQAQRSQNKMSTL